MIKMDEFVKHELILSDGRDISYVDEDRFIAYLKDKYNLKIYSKGTMTGGSSGIHIVHYFRQKDRAVPSVFAWLNKEGDRIVYHKMRGEIPQGFDLNKEWVIDPEMSTYKKEALLVSQGLQKALEREYEKLGLTEDEKDKRCQYLNMIMTPDADVLALATSDSPLELAEAIKHKYKKAHKELYEINRNKDGSHD